MQTKRDFDEDEDEENWYELRVDSKQPERRANHSSFVLGSKMYIYGGYDMREGPMSSFWSFDFNNVGELSNCDLNTKMPSLSWNAVTTQGVKKPSALSNHTSVIYKQKMYLYGGSSGLSSNVAFFCLDTASNLWEPVRTKSHANEPHNTPTESDEHTAVVHHEDMIIFGGFIDGDRVDSVFKFNFIKAEWKQIFQYEKEANPSARAGHSSVVVEEEGGNSFMYVFGGKDNNDIMLNDLWRMNLQTEKWEHIAYDEAKSDG